MVLCALAGFWLATTKRDLIVTTIGLADAKNDRTESKTLNGRAAVVGTSSVYGRW